MEVSLTRLLYDCGDGAEASGNVKLGWLVGNAGVRTGVTSWTTLADEGNGGRSRVSRFQMKF
jgi:hypothetical protein